MLTECKSVHDWNDGYDCGLEGKPKIAPEGVIKMFWNDGWEKGRNRRDYEKHSQSVIASFDHHFAKV